MHRPSNCVSAQVCGCVPVLYLCARICVCVTCIALPTSTARSCKARRVFASSALFICVIINDICTKQLLLKYLSVDGVRYFVCTMPYLLFKLLLSHLHHLIAALHQSPFV